MVQNLIIECPPCILENSSMQTINSIQCFVSLFVTRSIVKKKVFFSVISDLLRFGLKLPMIAVLFSPIFLTFSILIWHFSLIFRSAIWIEADNDCSLMDVDRHVLAGTTSFQPQPGKAFKTVSREALKDATY